MSNLLLRCRKCRNYLNENHVNCIVSVHGVTLDAINYSDGEVSCLQLSDVFYIKDTSMPQWIIDSVNQAGWLKGKLSCPHCSARLGSFDFISGSKCACNNFVLPPIHIVKSKVDYNFQSLHQ